MLSPPFLVPVSKSNCALAILLNVTGCCSWWLWVNRLLRSGQADRCLICASFWQPCWDSSFLQPCGGSILLTTMKWRELPCSRDLNRHSFGRRWMLISMHLYRCCLVSSCWRPELSHRLGTSRPNSTLLMPSLLAAGLVYI